jgi:alcohol dehydrogenase
MNFAFSLTKDIRFGRGVSLETGEVLKEYGANKVMLVHGHGVEQAGLIAPIRESIEKKGIAVVDFNEVLPNPLNTTVEKGAQLGRDEKIDGIVAIGGGSAMDCAKAINILQTNAGNIALYAGINKAVKKGLLLVAIPTTAGTSSDITAIAVITDAERNRRYLVKGKNVGADISLVDPALIENLPARISAASGIDAFTHAVESYVSLNASPITELMSLKAIGLIYNSLPGVVNGKGDREAHDNMMLGCIFAGCAFSNAGLGLAHIIANPLTTDFGIVHGFACGVTLPYVIEFNEPVVKEKTMQMANAACPGTGKSMAELVLKMEKEIGIPTISECGVPEDKLSYIAAEAMKGHFDTTPRKAENQEDILGILKKAF